MPEDEQITSYLSNLVDDEIACEANGANEINNIAKLANQDPNLLCVEFIIYRL